MDKSTVSDSEALLLAYVRYIKENLLRIYYSANRLRPQLLQLIYIIN